VLQDSFCACVNRHVGPDSKDWGDAVAYAILLKLNVNTPPYKEVERVIRKSDPSLSLSKMDRVMDSLLVLQEFGKCLSLSKIQLKDTAGFFSMIHSIRAHPPLLQNQLLHMRALTGQALLDYLRNGVSDSVALLFDRQGAFDSVKTTLEEVSKSVKGKRVRAEIKFEKLGRDSCGIAKMKLLQDGTHSLGGVRIIYRRGDLYAKIIWVSALIRDDFKEEELIDVPHQR